jgi:hypothetical protein
VDYVSQSLVQSALAYISNIEHFIRNKQEISDKEFDVLIQSLEAIMETLKIAKTIEKIRESEETNG